MTALHIAADNGHYQVVETLIAAKASLNLQTNVSIASIEDIGRCTLDSIYQLTVTVTMSVYIQTIICDNTTYLQTGQTALWISSSKGYNKIVSQLLTAGAKLDTQRKVSWIVSVLYTHMHIIIVCDYLINVVILLAQYLLIDFQCKIVNKHITMTH